VEDRLLLVSESLDKRLVHEGHPEFGFRKDSWSIWELPGHTGASDPVPDDSGVSQGMRRWKVEWTEADEIAGMAISPRDNLLVIAGPMLVHHSALFDSCSDWDEEFMA
jgi:hypothetical protein